MATTNTRPAGYKRAFEALTALLLRYPHGRTAARKTIVTPDEHESFPKGPAHELRSSRSVRSRIHSDRGRRGPRRASPWTSN